MEARMNLPAGSREIVTVAEAARLMNAGESSIKRYIESGKLEAAITLSALGGGAGGTAYRVYVDSLPVDAQIKYWQGSALAEVGAGCQEFDLAGYRMRKGEDGMAELLRRQRAALAAHGLRMRYEDVGLRGYTEALSEIAGELGVPTMTLYRWERGYAEKGLAGVVRPVRADAGQSRSMCLLARDYTEFLMSDNHKPTQNYVMEKVQKRAQELGESGCDECPYRANSGARMQAMDRGQELPVCDEDGQGMIPPSNRYSVNRAIELIPKSILAYARYGSRLWDAHYQQKVIREKPERINDVWFGDHHECDVMVLDRDGRVVRPWITVVLDAHTDGIAGWMLTLNPNSDTIARSFTLAVLPTKGSVFKGLPMVFYMDNGKDYRSHRFEGNGEVEYPVGQLNMDLYNNKSMMEVLGVEVKRAKEYWAWTKPIERVFGTLEDRWMRDFPGWCGGSWKERPQDLGREIKRLLETGGLMTFATFAECFKEKVIDAYHNYRSDKDGLTPLERYQRGTFARTDQPDEATMSIIQKQEATRVVRTQGVSLGGELYQDIALGMLIGERVQLKYWRDDTDSVTVFYRGRFVCIAERADTMRMVERDQEKVKRVMTEKGALRRGVTGHIRQIEQNVRGVHREAFAEEIDEQRSRALAVIGNIEAQKAKRAEAEVDKRRKRRAGELDAGERAMRDKMIAWGAEISRMREG